MIDLLIIMAALGLTLILIGLIGAIRYGFAKGPVGPTGPTIRKGGSDGFLYDE